MKKINYSSQIAKGALIAFLGMFLGKGLTYLYTILVARLGSSTYGSLTLGFTISLLLASIAMVGLNTGIVRYVSFYLGKNERKGIKGTILSSIKISLPISVIFMILLFIFSKQISVNIFHNSDLTLILRWLSLTIPLVVLGNIFSNVMIAFKKIEYSVGINEVVENIIKLVLTFILIYLGYGLFGATISYLIAIFITAFLTFYFLQRKVFPFINTKIKSIDNKKELLNFSLPLLFATLFSLIIKWSDILILGYYKDSSNVGIYNVSLSTANLLALVPTALMAIFLPIITNLYSKNNIKEIKEIAIRTSKWIFFLNLPIFIFLIIFPKEFLGIMFGGEYALGYIGLYILLFGYIIHSLSHVNSNVLFMLKKTKIVFIVSIVTSLFSIILNLLLIPRYGLVGGAIGTSSALILSFLIYLILSYKLIKLFIFNLKYLKFFFSGLISSLITIFLRNLLNLKTSLVNLIILAFIFGIIYLIFNVVFKSFDKQDKLLFLEIKNKIIKKILFKT